MTNERLLTDAELELMQVLWTEGPLTARQVLEHLGGERAYTTIATILRILVDKGFAETEKVGRAHRFVPCVSRSDYQLRKLGAVVDALFDSNPVSLVRQLVRSRDLSEDELADLKRFVDEELEP